MLQSSPSSRQESGNARPAVALRLGYAVALYMNMNIAQAECNRIYSPGPQGVRFRIPGDTDGRCVWLLVAAAFALRFSNSHSQWSTGAEWIDETAKRHAVGHGEISSYKILSFNAVPFFALPVIVLLESLEDK